MLYQAELFPDRSFTPQTIGTKGARQERAYSQRRAGWQAGIRMFRVGVWPQFLSALILQMTVRAAVPTTAIGSGNISI